MNNNYKQPGEDNNPENQKPENEQEEIYDTDEQNNSAQDGEENLDENVKSHTDKIKEGLKNYTSKKDDEQAEKINALSEEVAKLKEQLSRSIAENENQKKRFEKELADTRKYAITSFVKELMPVMDNLYRAMEYQPNTENIEDETTKNLVSGMQMIQDELHKAFDQFKITRLEPEPGDNFDYNYHQAVVQVPSNEYTEGAIVEVMQAGYLLEDRLLRPVLVSVAKAVSNEEQE
jgi:molecular chaperone GrpE